MHWITTKDVVLSVCSAATKQDQEKCEYYYKCHDGTCKHMVIADGRIQMCARTMCYCNKSC